MNKDLTSVPLNTPITRKGAEPITSVGLRRPKGGDLRGIKITDLLQMDYVSLEKVLPRISHPALATSEIADLEPDDLVTLGGTVSGFFVNAAKLKEAGLD